MMFLPRLRSCNLISTMALRCGDVISPSRRELISSSARRIGIGRRGTPTRTINTMAAPTHHKVVALETFYCPVPQLELPAPHTYEITEYDRTKVEDIPARIRDADIVIVTTIPMKAAVIAETSSPNLRMIAAVASGTDSIDLAACKARGVHVANTPHCNATSVAEHAIAGYFACRRSIPLTHVLIRRGEWPKRPLFKLLNSPDDVPPRTCGSEVMGILGYGAIGKQIEAKAKALGMKVLIAGRKGAESAPEGRTDFLTVLKESSVIVLCLPRMAETLNLMSTPEFAVMQSHALIVNVSRGGIVDEEALVVALKERKIAGASTDVYLQEPATPENSRLLKPDTEELNLVLTPHTAWCAEDTNDNYQQCLKKNISTWLLGNPTNTVV